MKNVFQKIAESRASGGGAYIKDGRGLLVVKNLKHDPDCNDGETFIAEFLVVESESYPDVADEKGNPVKANTPGSSCSYVQQLEKFDSAPGNTKGLILTLMGESEESLAESAAATAAELQKTGKLPAGGWSASDEFIQTYKTVTGKDQPLRGKSLKYETYRKKIRGGANAGKPITLPRWEYVEEGVDAIQAKRAKLEGTADAT